MGEQSWLIRKETGGGIPSDTRHASIVGPDTLNPVRVVPESELAAARRTIAEMGEALKAADELAEQVEESFGLGSRGISDKEFDALIERMATYRQRRGEGRDG